MLAMLAVVSSRFPHIAHFVQEEEAGGGGLDCGDCGGRGLLYASDALPPIASAPYREKVDGNNLSRVYKKCVG